MDLVDRPSFDASLARALADCRHPGDGLHGPGSMSWRVGRESILFLGGGAAALLQLSHPFVAHAVDQHSATRSDPVGRFNRTFQHVYAMVFGELDAARASAERVRTVHERIRGRISEDVGRFRKGDPYMANDPDALLWVHATLVYTAVQVYDLTVEPLSLAEKNLYWHESKRFAQLFGIPHRVMPRDWTAFERYWERALVEDLAVGKPAAEMGRFLLSAPRPSSEPVMRWYRLMTAGLLPQALRQPYGLSFSDHDARAFRRHLRAIRPMYRSLPRRLRDVPAYVEAWRRLEGNPRPDRFGRALERFVLRAVQPA